MMRKRALNSGSRNRARRRWPNLDVHDVKQRSFAAAGPAAAIVFVVTGERGFMTAHPGLNSREVARRRRARAGAKARSTDRCWDLRKCYGPSRSLLPVGGGVGPPPVIPVVSTLTGSDRMTRTAPPRARRVRRRVVGKTRRWKR
jgi:hypothetical protein